MYERAEVQFAMFTELYKTRIGGRSFSSITDNLLDFYTKKD